MKILSLPKHENLTTSKNYCVNEEKLLQRSNFSSFPQYFRYISNFKSPISYKFVKCGCSNYFSSIIKIWYVEVQISRSVSESPLELDITGVDCSLLAILLLIITDILICNQSQRWKSPLQKHWPERVQTTASSHTLSHPQIYAATAWKKNCCLISDDELHFLVPVISFAERGYFSVSVSEKNLCSILFG